jgi:hypothetical protein
VAQGRESRRQDGILEFARRGPVVVEKGFELFALCAGELAGRLSLPGGQLESPDEMLDHLPGRHLSPSGPRIILELGERIEEQTTEKGVA